MNVIKVNYNNVYVKVQRKITPGIFYGHLEDSILIYFHDNITENDEVIDFVLTFTIDGEVVAYCNKTDDQPIIIDKSKYDHNIPTFLVITGYYVDELNNRFPIDELKIKLFPTPVCSRYLICSENNFVGTLVQGYYHDNKFYETKEDDLYSNEIVSRTFSLYFDLEGKHLYKWNSDNEEFVIL